jgi:flagellar basal-body rod protein FlgB
MIYDEKTQETLMGLELGGVTTHLIGLALDAAMLRHETIANNIANHHTPGYQAKRVNFETHLSDMMAQLENGTDNAVKSQIESLRTYLLDGNAVTISQNEKVELDREMVRLAENRIRYQAILNAASKQGDLLSLAINGGRQS